MTFQKNVCFGIFKKPLVKNVIHDISKNVCFEIFKKPLVKNVIHDISKKCVLSILYNKKFLKNKYKK